MADETLPDIQAIQTRLQSDWSARDEMIEEIRALRFMENPVDVPVPMKAEIVQTPVGHQIVERLVGTLTADPLTITVPPGSEKADAQERSSLMERFALPALDQMEKQADQDVIDQFVEHLIADGHGCMRMLWHMGYWRGLPRRDSKGNEGDKEYSERTDDWKAGKPMPIAWNALDPLTVYPLWGEFGLEGILEVDDRDLLTLDPQKWNVQKPNLENLARLKQGAGTVTFQQWWTPEYLTYAVEGQIVHHTKHRYGSPPYSYAFGLGAASRDPRYMGMSVLWPVRFLLPYLDRVVSQKATAVRMWCWPTIIFQQTALGQEAGPKDAIPTPRKIDVAPGGVTTLYQDETVSFLTWQGNGPDADEMIRLVQGMIERAGLADTMYGQSRGESGYAINQLLGAARMRLKPIVAHAERALEQQICHLFDIVEYQIKQSVHVFSYGKGGGWIKLGPDDLKGYRQLKVRLNPLLPTDTYARSSQALNEVRGQLRSRASAMEMIGIEQPDEEKRKIRVDRWESRPEVDAFFGQEAVKRAGQKLAQGDLTMSKLMGQYGELPQGLQGVIAQQLQAVAPQGQSVQALGMQQPMAGQPAMGGQPAMQQPMGAPAMPTQGMQQAPPGLTPQLMQAIAMLAQRFGVPPQVLLQRLIQQAQRMGIPLAALVQMLMQRLQQGGGGAGPGRMPQSPPGPSNVMAQPGMRAIPTPPRVGPSTRPSGIATGRAPGTRRRGSE